MSTNKFRAIHAVLATYELLERILLYVAMKQLYTLQRTSKTFLEIIPRSHPLQQKLFRLASGPPTDPIMPGPLMTPRKLSIPDYPLEGRQCNPNIGVIRLEHSDTNRRGAKW
ncbi:hypothetical protein DOTSEDRAFT_29729 [Dothistroma septosporum NZE10]|uniref:F-box domain-containing protein n=1 Tax=Dothistroma septosporum (strain NZE10 / CBS 128990) TaxID=675120 RepID=M2YI15_DOTSN|nr:hypothetical protein DOTSEDRAFT_29729 [Dothistroma septosporum NZE10]